MHQHYHDFLVETHGLQHVKEVPSPQGKPMKFYMTSCNRWQDFNLVTKLNNFNTSPTFPWKTPKSIMSIGLFGFSNF